MTKKSLISFVVVALLLCSMNLVVFADEVVPMEPLTAAQPIQEQPAQAVVEIPVVVYSHFPIEH